MGWDGIEATYHIPGLVASKWRRPVVGVVEVVLTFPDIIQFWHFKEHHLNIGSDSGVYSKCLPAGEEKEEEEEEVKETLTYLAQNQTKTEKEQGERGSGRGMERCVKEEWIWNKSFGAVSKSDSLDVIWWRKRGETCHLPCSNFSFADNNESERRRAGTCNMINQQLVLRSCAGTEAERSIESLFPF